MVAAALNDDRIHTEMVDHASDNTVGIAGIDRDRVRTLRRPQTKRPTGTVQVALAGHIKLFRQVLRVEALRASVESGPAQCDRALLRIDIPGPDAETVVVPPPGGSPSFFLSARIWFRARSRVRNGPPAVPGFVSLAPGATWICTGAPIATVLVKASAATKSAVCACMV